jgi:hypothetical protein
VKQPISSIYFPLGCIMSLIAPIGDEEVEVAAVGPEGSSARPPFWARPPLCNSSSSRSSCHR